MKGTWVTVSGKLPENTYVYEQNNADVFVGSLKVRVVSDGSGEFDELTDPDPYELLQAGAYKYFLGKDDKIAKFFMEAAKQDPVFENLTSDFLTPKIAEMAIEEGRDINCNTFDAIPAELKSAYNEMPVITVNHEPDKGRATSIGDAMSDVFVLPENEYIVDVVYIVRDNSQLLDVS